jgi:hypothetical protein
MPVVRRRENEEGSGTAAAMPVVKSVIVRVSNPTSVLPGHVVPVAMHGIIAGLVSLIRGEKFSSSI